MIPKANGGERPLGIPTVRDRIAQTVCKMILEPIFEADFEESSYGFRPNRSSRDTITAIKEHLKRGNTEVYDADLSKYFDTIPHDKLLITFLSGIPSFYILVMQSIEPDNYQLLFVYSHKTNYNETVLGINNIIASRIHTESARTTSNSFIYLGRS
jgi:hypothetical protein